MVRDLTKGNAYFDDYVTFLQMTSIEARKNSIGSLARPERHAGCVSSLVQYGYKLCIARCSCGDHVSDIQDSILQAIELLELNQSILASVELLDHVAHAIAKTTGAVGADHPTYSIDVVRHYRGADLSQYQRLS